jgi:hypothetical protein
MLEYIMKSISYPNTTILINSGSTGSTGTILTSTSITTPSINTNMIVPTSGSGATNNVLVSTGNGITWDVPSSSNITNTTLNMNTKNINNATTISCTTINTSNITSSSTFANQTIFTSAPTSILPTVSTHLATKQYVDSKLVGGNYNLYLNRSQTETFPSGGNTGYFKLSSTLTSVTGQGITGTTTTVANVDTLIGSFITDAVNITNIPASLCVLNLYAGITSTSLVFSLFFRLFKVSNIGVITSIGTSTNSSSSGDMNTTPTNYPDLYKMTLSLSSPISTVTTDRLLIRLYYNTSNATSTNYSIYLENKYYSYLTILVNNNSTTQLFGNATSNLSMSGYNITSTNDMTIGCTGKILTIGNQSSTINIGTNTSTSTNIILNGNTGVNCLCNLNCPLTVSYTAIPSTQQIGEIVTFTRPSGVTGFTNGQLLSFTYTLPYFGRWLINVTNGVFVVTAGTVTNIALYIRNNNGNIIIGENEENGSQTNTINDNTFIMNMTVGLITGNTIKTFTVSQSINFSSGQYVVSSDPYIVKALRLA